MKIISVFLALCIVTFGYYYIMIRGQVLEGKDWTAKKYASTYVVSIKNRADLVDALNDFVKVNKISLGSVTGIGAVNKATLRFFDPATKKYIDKNFLGQMEIANLTGNISTQDGKVYTHYHVTLGNDKYQGLAGHLLNATINGAGEFYIYTVPMGKLERTFDENIGLNFYDFNK